MNLDVFPQKGPQSSRRPLEGIRVIDLSQVVSGPYGTLILANLGAEVIRIQRVEDVAAHASRSAPQGRMSEEDATDWGLNRGKRSVALNLKSKEGRDLLARLLRDADVMFSNFRPGKLEALGLGHADMQKLNPSLIACELNGFGSEGSWANMPSYDPIAQALSGTMSFTGSPDPKEMPVRWTVPIGDLFAGSMATIGVIAALIRRQKTGRGRHIEAAMHDVMLAMNSYRVPLALTFGEIPVPSPNEGGQGTVPYGSFRCADDRWISIGVSDRMWPNACRIIEREDLLADTELASNKGRWSRREEVIKLFRQELAKRPARQWEKLLLEGGIVAGVVNTVPEVLEHPQLRARGMIIETTDSKGHPVSVIGDPLDWDDPVAIRGPAPAGADTLRVLGDVLSIQPDELATLIKNGTIADGSDGEERPPLLAWKQSAQPVDMADTKPVLDGLAVVEMVGDEPSKGFTGRMLADLGARVIKLRRPPELGPEPYPNPVREAAYHASLDAGKSYVDIDLKAAEGKEGFLGLIKDADVLLDNYRTGVLDRLGLGEATLRDANPSLVPCSITGYGHTGPWARYAAFDAAIQAGGGSMSIAPIPPSMNGEPTRWGMPIGGMNGSLYAVTGILAGVFKRNRDGTSKSVDIALLDAQAALLSYRVPQLVGAGKQITADPRRGGTGALPFGPFQTSDQRWFSICITQQFWKPFVVLSGAADRLDKAEFATEKLRQQHETELNSLVTEVMQSKTAREWQQLFLAAQLPGAMVVNLKEAFEHPNVALRGMRMAVENAEFGPIEVAGNPIRIS